MMPFRCAVAATATVMLSACGLMPYEGQGDYPSAGPPPPPGTEWRTDDGAAGVKLGADGTAEVWGMPWYLDEERCEPSAITFVTATVDYEVWQTSVMEEIQLEYDIAGIADAPWDTAVAQLTRASSAPGWSTLMYQPCHRFNDGNDLELHLVE